MTREEAVAIIRKEYLCVDGDCDIERSCGKCDLMMPNKEPILQAYKLAIKALEHPEENVIAVVPCEDAISRQAVLDGIEELKKIHFDRVVVLNKVRDRVLDLPSVTPQPKPAHWILKVEDWNKWTCSNCGYSERTDVHVTLGYNYCPKCGEMMVESEGK